jgi:hypothetical protein
MDTGWTVCSRSDRMVSGIVLAAGSIGGGVVSVQDVSPAATRRSGPYHRGRWSMADLLSRPVYPVRQEDINSYRPHRLSNSRPSSGRVIDGGLGITTRVRLSGKASSTVLPSSPTWKGTGSHGRISLGGRVSTTGSRRCLALRDPCVPVGSGTTVPPVGSRGRPVPLPCQIRQAIPAAGRASRLASVLRWIPATGSVHVTVNGEPRTAHGSAFQKVSDSIYPGFPPGQFYTRYRRTDGLRYHFTVPPGTSV